MKNSSILTLLLLFIFINPSVAQILDQECNGTIDGGRDIFNESQSLGQSFTAGFSGMLTSISFLTYENSCSLNDKFIFKTEILEGDGMDGKINAFSNDTMPLPYSYGWYTVNFKNPAYIQKGNKYTIRLSTIRQDCNPTMQTIIEGNWYTSYHDVYPGGQSYIDTQPQPWDYNFRTYVMLCGLTDDQVSGNDNQYSCIGGVNPNGQTFTCGISGLLAAVDIDIQVEPCEFSSSYATQIDIIDTSNFKGNVIATKTLILPVPYPRALCRFKFNSPPLLIKGKKYTIRRIANNNAPCVYNSFIMDTARICSPWYLSGNNAYAGGDEITGDNVNNEHDFNFKTIMLPLYSDTSVTVNGITLTSNAAAVNYQWLDCKNSFLPIEGATGKSYTATANGSFAVVINTGDCIDTSACHAIVSFSVNELSSIKAEVFPNPVINQLNIRLANCNQPTEITIINAIGEQIYYAQMSKAITISTSSFSRGFYMLRLSTPASSAYYKIVKY